MSVSSTGGLGVFWALGQSLAPVLFLGGFWGGFGGSWGFLRGVMEEDRFSVLFLKRVLGASWEGFRGLLGGH